MNTQPEQVLENNLIDQLVALGHGRVTINSKEQLLANLRAQLEKHNKLTLTDAEFRQVINKLDKGTVFEKAHTLRDKMMVVSDSGDPKYLELLNLEHWCKNEFQVTNQVTIEGSFKNRYDVTLLVNGLPLVQIELKRRGIELKEAFNQVNRYQRHSYWSAHGLFQYVQIFIISNGVNTKYFSNNHLESFKQTFFWAHQDNSLVTQLEEFTQVFLEPCHMAKMITRYLVLHESDKKLMVLRPYQYYAAEAILDRVKNTHKGGYIWHTTGSGKTLTSFKASQLLMLVPKVHKVVFVVDRKDLDYQTSKEFNHFSDGSVDGTSNTRALVRQMTDDTKLIVTTIQKLNAAIEKRQFLSRMEPLQDKRIVFIFDECHRSQFGETHTRIRKFFEKAQMFGFTGTPIFQLNAVANKAGKRTTAMLFGDCLHRYVITDAIKDDNVLKFSIEYVGRYRQKQDSKNEIDIEVEGIDTKELMESPERLEKITDYILAHHNRKTHSRKFTSIFCVSSVEMLTHYYDLFRARAQEGKHNLRLATIFSFTANEDDKDATGDITDPDFDTEGKPVNQHSRDKLEEYIGDYNRLFGCSYTTKDHKSFYQYYENIAKRVKRKEIDILLVVNMFLTGFDSKTLNTLYVDKNLKFHGLLQAFSRTNRILNETKSQGNIVCFRNLKKATDDAIALFSNKEAKEEIIIAPYEEYVRKFNETFAKLLGLVPTLSSVDELASEDDKLAFIQAFRNLMRLRNVLITFADFSFEDLAMQEQDFEDYKSKYLDLYDQVKTDRQKEKVSILADVDFELELIHKDNVNVAYILNLLALMHGKEGKERKDIETRIIKDLTNDPRLRSKKELIEEFIEENLLHVEDSDDVPEAFTQFISEKQQKAFQELCLDEKLDQGKFQVLIEKYLFTEKEPLRDEIAESLIEKPRILERAAIIDRVLEKLRGFVDTFISDMPG